MKVLITTDWYKPAINGVVTSVVNLAEGLARLGHEVKILTLSGGGRSYTCGNVTYIGSVGVGLIYPNARIRTALSHKQVRALIDWKPDIVHSQCEFSTFPFAKTIAKRANAPLIHTYHTVYEDYTHYFSPNARFGKRLAAAFSRKILKYAARAVAPTEKTAALLRSYRVRPEIAVVPSGLDLSKFGAARGSRALREKLGFAESDTVLVFLGRLAKEKNIEELIGFLPKLPNSFRLLIVGGGPRREALEKLTAEKWLENRVVFTGAVNPDRTAEYYRAGDIFVSASQSETQGLTYIEAMACGLPVLCRADKCLEGVLEDGVNGFAYSGEEEFLSKALSLRNSAELRGRLGAQAVKSAEERFSAETFARAVSQVYSDALGEQA